MRNLIILIVVMLAISSCKKDDDGIYEDFYGYWEVDSAAFRTDENRVIIVTAPVYFFYFSNDKTVMFFNFYGVEPDTSDFKVTDEYLIMNISSETEKDSLFYEFSGEELRLWKMDDYFIDDAYHSLYQQKYFLKKGEEP